MPTQGVCDGRLVGSVQCWSESNLPLFTVDVTELRVSPALDEPSDPWVTVYDERDGISRFDYQSERVGIDRVRLYWLTNLRVW